MSEKIDLTREFLNVSKERTQLAKAKEEAANAREAARKAKEERFSFENCLKLLNETMVDKNSFEYMTVKQLLTKPAIRELFVLMEDTKRKNSLGTLVC